jgi:AcrR family transcriptional regulator
MPAALLSRDDVVARIQEVFRDRGFDGASLTEISTATGLGKSSLYHYFPGGKDEMAVAVLERIDAWMNAHALAALRGTGTPKARLRAMLHVLDAFYVGGRNACVLGNLVIGGSRAKFQAYLASAFGGWIAALRALAIESGVPRDGSAAARRRRRRANRRCPDRRRRSRRPRAVQACLAQHRARSAGLITASS